MTPANRQYAKAAKVFDTPIIPQEDLDARRAKLDINRSRRRRGIAIKGTGLLLTAALAVSVAPKAAELAGQGVKAGAGEVVTNVSTFGTVTGENINSATETVGGVLATVKNQIDAVLDSEQKMHETNADNVGVTEEHRERLGRQAVEAMRQGEAATAEQSQTARP